MRRKVGTLKREQNVTRAQAPSAPIEESIATASDDKVLRNKVNSTIAPYTSAFHKMSNLRSGLKTIRRS